LENYKNISPLYEEIKHRLRKVRRKQNFIDFITGIALSASVYLILLLLSIIIEYLFTLGKSGRTVMFFFYLIVTTSFSFYFIGKPILKFFGIIKNESDSKTAQKVGAKFPGINDRLLNTLQVYEFKLPGQNLYSLELIDASFVDLYEAIHPINFIDAANKLFLKRFRKYFFYSLAVFILFIMVSPREFLFSAYRIFKFNESFSALPRIVLMIEPGDAEVIRGENVSITIHPIGAPVKEIFIHTREEGVSKFDIARLQITNDGVFRFSISNIKSTTHYFASAADIKSPEYKITVLDRPIIRSLNLTLNYPAYSRISTKALEENVGDVTALPGTRISADILASKNLSEAALLFSDSSTQKLKLSENLAKGTFSLFKNRN
jgi:hypothetical protein